MDLELTGEQRILVDQVIEFSRKELNDGLDERDRAESFPREAWKRCAAFGLQGLPVPEAYGGSGADPVTVALALEALGYGCKDNGLIFSLNAQMWSCQTPLIAFGTEDQKRRYLPSLTDGSAIGVQAMTEPGAGSDAFALRTVAREEGNHFVLTGTKTFITNAPVADIFVVFASTDRDKGFAGLSAFLVDRDANGLHVGAPMSKMGLRTSPMAELSLDGCKVPRESVLGRPGAGATIFNSSMEWERTFILAAAVGTIRRQLETCISYSRARRQFDRPISDFQAVSHKLADMRVRLETARLVLYHTAWLKGHEKKVPLESSIVKLHLSESFVQSSLDAMQIHGAYGYMADQDMERDLRDALASRIYSGTSEIQRNLIAAHLGIG